MSDSKEPLPSLPTSLTQAEVLARLLSLAKRGKLAGFAQRSDGPDFETEAHGTMFDFRLEATLNTGHGASHLQFALRPVWKTPIFIAIVTILAAGPGLWLTHSMMLTYFSWYHLSLFWTAVWYEGLTIIPMPWILLRAWQKSRTAATEHAKETIAKIAAALA